MSLNRRLISVAAVLPVLLMPFWAHAQDNSKDWHHSAYVYVMGAAIDGKAQIGPVEVPVDLSVSDVFGALEFGAMAAYRAENDTWSFSADATFMGLAGSDTTEGGRLNGTIDVDWIDPTIGSSISTMRKEQAAWAETISVTI